MNRRCYHRPRLRGARECGRRPRDARTSVVAVVVAHDRAQHARRHVPDERAAVRHPGRDVQEGGAALLEGQALGRRTCPAGGPPPWRRPARARRWRRASGPRTSPPRSRSARRSRRPGRPPPSPDLPGPRPRCPRSGARGRAGWRGGRRGGGRSAPAPWPPRGSVFTFPSEGPFSSGTSGVPWGTAMAWRTMRRRMRESPSMAWIHEDVAASRRRPRLAHGGQGARDDVGGQEGEERLVMGAAVSRNRSCQAAAGLAHGIVAAHPARVGLASEPFGQDVVCRAALPARPAGYGNPRPRPRPVP